MAGDMNAALLRNVAPRDAVQRRFNTALIDATQSVRKLLGDAGRRVTVVFGDFHSMLAPQLSEPTRLRPEHRLQCQLQIFEVIMPQRFGALRAAVATAGGYDGQLVKLDAPIAQRLGLHGELPGSMVHAAIWREPDVVLPGERFLQLRVLHDPTSASSTNRTLTDVTGENTANDGPRVPALRRKRSLRALSIPRRYLRPWEFKYTRNEALYDMRAPRPSLVRSLLDRFGRAARIRKWRVLLYGRTALDQLWAVRPPRRAYQDREVIAWVERMLSAAGYDVARWLPEWEIFWRRKGV